MSEYIPCHNCQVPTVEDCKRCKYHDPERATILYDSRSKSQTFILDCEVCIRPTKKTCNGCEKNLKAQTENPQKSSDEARSLEVTSKYIEFQTAFELPVGTMFCYASTASYHPIWLRTQQGAVRLCDGFCESMEACKTTYVEPLPEDSEVTLKYSPKEKGA